MGRLAWLLLAPPPPNAPGRPAWVWIRFRVRVRVRVRGRVNVMVREDSG